MKDLNILITGVGGQGTLLASRVFGNFALALDYDCKLSEVHGMAQRGGSVVTHVKMGKKVYSPVISEGTADVIISFEMLEALRYSHFLKKDAMLIVNQQKLMPMPVVSGVKTYPEEIVERLEAKGFTVKLLNALEIAESSGSIKAVNIAMIGAAAKVLGLDYNTMLEAVKNSVPLKTHAVNIKAFELGFNSL